MDTKNLQKVLHEAAREFEVEDDFEQEATQAFTRAFKDIDKGDRKRRQRLLVLLANMALESVALRKMMTSFTPEPVKEEIHGAQIVIQEIWQDLAIDDKQLIINFLLRVATKADRTELRAPLFEGALGFYANNFAGQLVLAVLENWTRMVVCGNPQCPAPYFFAKRSTQRYCERGECTKYSLRKKAKEWWSEHRAKKGTSHAKRSNRKNK